MAESVSDYDGPCRYSKLPFRALVRDYAVDLCYTPMVPWTHLLTISSASLIFEDAGEGVCPLGERAPQRYVVLEASVPARPAADTMFLTDFTTTASDEPLVVQFGAHDPTDFARAAEMVTPYCDGVNLNCGCPQSWAIADGLGCALMKKPELVREMVMKAKERCGEEFCVSVKIRIHADIEETVRFVRVLEGSGVDYITVHGRTRKTRSSAPVDLEAIRAVREACTVPVIANGDCWSLEDAQRIWRVTGVDGE